MDRDELTLCIQNRESVIRACPKCAKPPLYLIWWLYQQEVEEVLDLLALRRVTFPTWLETQVHELDGRPKRGRLWVAPHIPLDAIKWNDSAPLASVVASRGGIVVPCGDVHLINKLPGIVTSLGLDIPW